MSCDRTTATLLAAGFIILAFALLRASIGGPGMPDEVFWAQKFLFAPGAYDMVIAGDSRVNRAVSPRVIRQEMPGQRIANYGFRSTAYDAAYLRAVERLLDRDSHPRIIILGITPHAFTPHARANNGFNDLAGTPRRALRQRVFFGRWLYSFGSFVSVEKTAIGSYDRYEFTNYADGWTAMRVEPLIPTMAVPDYRGFFADSQADPAAVDQLITTVRRWTTQGILVIGIRPPVSTEMIAVEEELSGFHEQAFVTAFTAAGGKWLAFSRHYQSYDGSHLVESAAIQFTRDLTDRIQQLRD